MVKESLNRIGNNLARALKNTPARQETRLAKQARIARIGSRVGLAATAITIISIFAYTKVSELVNKSPDPNSTPLSPPVLKAPIDLNGIIYCEIPGDSGPTEDGRRADCGWPSANDCDISYLKGPILLPNPPNLANKCQTLKKSDLKFDPLPTSAGVPDLLLHSTPQPIIKSTPVGISCDKPGLSNIKVKGGYATCIWPPEKCKISTDNPIWMLIGITGNKLNAQPSCQVLTQKDLGVK